MDSKWVLTDFEAVLNGSELKQILICSEFILKWPEPVWNWVEPVLNWFETGLLRGFINFYQAWIGLKHVLQVLYIF